MMETIKQILIQRGYPENAAVLVAEKLSMISPRLKPALDTWLRTGAEPEECAEGFSTKNLMKKQKNMKYPAALLSIDWLLRDPHIAKPIIEKGLK